MVAELKHAGGRILDDKASETDYDARPWLRPEFDQFRNWLEEDGPGGRWPVPRFAVDLTPEQKRITAANAALLLDRTEWHIHVDAFEELITALPEGQRKATRAAFAIRFDRQHFADGKKNFREYRFPCFVTFAWTQFGGGDISFALSQFAEGGVLFDNARFGDGNVSFSGAQFKEGDVSFDGAQFGDCNVSFEGALFGRGETRFNETVFGKGIIDFYRALFRNCDVSFQNTFFNSADISFEEAKFTGSHVRFDRIRIPNGAISFLRTKFDTERLVFLEIALGNTIFNAPNMRISGNLYVRSRFPKSADLRQLKVEGTANFSGSTFAETPDFRDAKFDRSPEVAGMVVPPPKLAMDPGREGVQPIARRFFKLAADRDDVAKYRKLKAMALAANDHEKDGEFFSYEMLAKRGVETKGFWGLAFNSLYWRLSDFGQSFGKPACWWGASIGLFAFLNTALIQIAAPQLCSTIAGRGETLIFSVTLSLKNSLPLLGSLFRAVPAPDDFEGWFQRYYNPLGQNHPAAVDWLVGLGVLQAIFGGVLLFLFLLALRNRFRLK